MIRRIGFRRLLPVAFTLLHLILLVYPQVSEVRARAPNTAPPEIAVAYQEGVGEWKPNEPKAMSSAQKIAVLLNLPSLLLAIPLAQTAFRGSDIALLYAAFPFVPIVWYGIGRWIDGTLGYIRQGRRLPRSLSGFLVVVFAGLFLASAMVIARMDHHREPDALLIGTALMAWPGLFFAMSLSSFRRPSRE